MHLIDLVIVGDVVDVVANHVGDNNSQLLPVSTCCLLSQILSEISEDMTCLDWKLFMFEGFVSL